MAEDDGRDRVCDNILRALHDMRDAAGSALERGSEFASSVADGISNTARDAAASIKPAMKKLAGKI
jgi:hypothetical protein